MATDEQITRFVHAFLSMSENMRKSGVYNDDMLRQLCVLHNIRNCQAQNGRRMTITDVSNVTGMALSNVSRFLRPLEERGLIEREKEGRTIYLNITAAGERLFDERVAAVRKILHEMLGALSEEEADIFLSYSEKFSETLNNIIEQNKKGDSNV